MRHAERSITLGKRLVLLQIPASITGLATAIAGHGRQPRGAYLPPELPDTAFEIFAHRFAYSLDHLLRPWAHYTV